MQKHAKSMQKHPSYEAKACKSTLVLCKSSAKTCKIMGFFYQKVQNYAKAPFMNLNNAKAASFYPKTCKTPNVLIQITQKHTLLMQNPAKVCSHSFDTKCTNHAKSCKSNAKACKSTLLLIVALLFFFIKVQNYTKSPLMNLNNAKAPSFDAKTLIVLTQIM